MNRFMLLGGLALIFCFSEVTGAGIGNDNKLLTTVDYQNPHLVSEVISNLAVSCYVTAQDIEGEVLTVSCPPSCHLVSDKLWGSGKYMGESYVCAAAIHSGRISSERGGSVTFRKLPGMANYEGSYLNGLTSKPSLSANTTFVFQDAADAKQSLYAVSCFAKAKFTTEDSYIAICPAGCDLINEQVWGTGIYSTESYLCAAAIHDGKIMATKGGRVVITKKPLQETFNGSTQNKITSKSSNISSLAFRIEDCPQSLSAVLSVGCGFRADHVLEDYFTVSCPTGCGDSNSHVVGNDPYAVYSHVCAAAVHNGLIDISLGGIVSVEKHANLRSFKGGRRNGVTSSESKQPSRSYVLGGATEKGPQMMRVSCEATANDILEERFSVKCPKGCNFNSWEKIVIGAQVYTTTSHICFSAIHAGVIDDQMGGLVTVRKIGKQTLFKSTNQSGIESTALNSSQDAFMFGGYIEKEKTDLTVSCNFPASKVIDLEFTVICPHDCVRVPPSGWVDLYHQGVYSAPTAICSISHQLEGKKITIRRTSAGIKFVGKFSDYVESENGLVRKPGQGQYLIQDAKFPEETVLSVDCGVKASDINMDFYTAICPAGCSNESRVYGTGVYSDDSSICLAAIHDGRIEMKKGGAVRLRKTEGLDSYVGSFANQLRSETKSEAWIASFVFQNSLQHKTSTFTISCETTGNIINSEEFGVVCPSGCKDFFELWGSENYSDFSQVCIAAMHAGKITDKGGVVRVRKTSPRKAYKGSISNGIFSMSQRGTGEKSFTFL